VEVWYLKAPHADTLISEYDVRGVRTGRVSEVASAQEVLEVSSLVGRCRLTGSKPVLTAPTVSALETKKW